MVTSLPLRALAGASRPLAVATPAASIAARVNAARWASSSSQPEASSSTASSTEATSSILAKGKAPASAHNGKDAKPDPYEVPPLPRPLGVHVHPTGRDKSWAQRKEEMLDRDRHKAKRRALVKEATQGYFHDYNLARKANGGKLWVAPPVLIREDHALYFPDITGKALTGEHTHTTSLWPGKVSLVSILNTRVSEEHVQSFVKPVLEDWTGQPGFQYVQLNHQPNPLKSMLLSFFVSSLKRTMSEDLWSTYLISSGEWSPIDIAGPLGLENKLLGYVFLVDSAGKVRWAGCGAATPKETEDLRRAAAVLMRRSIEVASPVAEPATEAAQE